jgi:hypothetical protein
MHNALLMGVLDCVTNFGEKPEPGGQIQMAIAAIVRDGHAIHQLHHEVQSSGIRGSRIEHAGDAGMFHERQRLALRLEASHSLLRIHAWLDDL